MVGTPTRRASNVPRPAMGPSAATTRMAQTICVADMPRSLRGWGANVCVVTLLGSGTQRERRYGNTATAPSGALSTRLKGVNSFRSGNLSQNLVIKLQIAWS